MSKIWKWFCWLWASFCNYLAAKELWLLVGGSTAGAAALSAIAVRVFTPLSFADTAIVAVFFGAVAFWLAVRFSPTVQHIHHLPIQTQTAPVASMTAQKLRALSPPQMQLLGLLGRYQQRFAASKLVIGRDRGELVFDGDLNRGQGISIITDLFGSVDQASQTRFVDLMESMPPEHIRFIPETRWDSPFVISLTEAALIFVRDKSL